MPGKVSEFVHLMRDELKPGEHFVAKKGVLKKEHSLWSRIKYFFLHKEQDAAVKKVISAEVSQLIHDPTLTDDEKKEFFFNNLAKLPQEIFDRALITKEFSYILDPSLEKTRKKNRNALDQQLKLEHRIRKVQLAQKLGVDLKLISAGMSGSYFARDYKFKILGVFKPGSEEPLDENSPKLLTRLVNLVLKHVIGINIGAPFWNKEGYLAEAMTSKLADHLRFKTVPASKVTELNSRKFHSANKASSVTSEKGSFQLFVKNTRSANEEFNLHSLGAFGGGLMLKLNLWRYKDRISKALDQTQFEELALIDLLICNRDRHFENWLLSPTQDKNKFDIHLIDNQMAFPKENPSKEDVFYRLNQFKWARMPQAKVKFSSAMQQLANEQLRGLNLAKLIENLANVTGGHGKGFKTRLELAKSSQEIAFKQRVAFILKGMEVGLTIRELAKIKSLEEIESFLRKNGLSLDECAINHYLGLT